MRAAIVFIAAIGVPLLIVLLFRPVRGAGKSAALLVLLFASPFLLVSIFVLTSDIRIVLSRDRGQMVLEQRRFGFRSRSNIPLSDIAYAKVETGDQQARALVIVLQSGTVISLTDQTDRRGHYAAANAINDFLGIRNSPQ
jgi:hypothetical protein